jgi:tetratricopeptide (TPR) repeat protein
MATSQASKTGSVKKAKRARSRAATIMIVMLVLLLVAGGGLFAYSSMSNKSTDQLYSEGQSAFQSGDYAGAVSKYKEAIKKDPEAEGYDLLGMALSYEFTKEKKPELEQQALDAYKQAVTLNPDDPASLLNYGGSLFNAGKLKESIPYLQKVLQVDPGNADKTAIEEMIKKAQASN